MADPKLTQVVVGQDNSVLDFKDKDDVAAIGGSCADVRTGTQGISYAGAGGRAESLRYGIAIVGPNGSAFGGAGTVVCAYDGGSARGGDGAVAWARREGLAQVDAYGVATAIDSKATAGRASLATVLRQNARDAEAHVASEGIAVVRNHPAAIPASGPATASADTGGIAVAFDDNYVKGAPGSLLVVAYTLNGQVHFATGVVDGITLKADQKYTADHHGGFVEC